MRVNISYSVELGDVPDEVERMLVECDKKIRAIHDDLVEVRTLDPLEIIKELDIIRIKMAHTDLQLYDCMQILSGYVQAMAKLPMLKQSESPDGAPLSEENHDE